MNVRAEKSDSPCDLLVVGMFDHESNQWTTKIDEKVNNEISTAIKRKEFTGEFGQLKMFSTLGKFHAQKVLVVGLGKKAEYAIEQLRRASASAIRVAQSTNSRKTITTLNHLETDHADELQRIA